MCKFIVRGFKLVNQMFVLTMTAYNLTRMRIFGRIRPSMQLELENTKSGSGNEGNLLKTAFESEKPSVK